MESLSPSWFNKRSWEKANAYGRIELIDGERLQQLARETLGIDVLVAQRSHSDQSRQPPATAAAPDAAAETQLPEQSASARREQQTFVINTTDSVLKAQSLIKAISAMGLTVNETSHRGHLRRLYVAEADGRAFKTNELHALVEALDGTVETDGAYIGITRSEVEEKLHSEANAGEKEVVEPDPNSPLDLMQLTPLEFEDFVRQLLEASSLDSWMALPNSDGFTGLMVKRDPLAGDPIIISAKRYRTVVGLKDVRELIGGLDHAGAVRGMVITTS